MLTRIIQLFLDFLSYYLDDGGIVKEIARVYKNNKIIIDPHSACGTFSAEQARKNNEIDEKTPIISLACAHPCKFPDAVYKSIKVKPSLPNDSKDLLLREKKSLFAPADHSTVKSIIEGYRRF